MRYLQILPTHAVSNVYDFKENSYGDIGASGFSNMAIGTIP